MVQGAVFLRIGTPYLQKDFGAFKLAVGALMGELEKSVDSDVVSTARTKFKNKKPDYDTLKKDLQGWKTTVNDAASGEKAAVSRAKGKMGEVNKTATSLLNTLKGKSGKEADLSKQLVTFANAAGTVQSIDDPKTIDDAL